jgi:hypothetical protein
VGAKFCGGKMKKNYLRDIPDSDVVDNMKIDCQDYFELVYIRHRYFRNSTNPEPERLAEFEEMICNISDKFFIRNYQVFNEVGFEMEDVRNVTRIHTISFISMGGLAENPDKMEQFRVRHKKKYGQDSEPDRMDIFRKECYDLARFLNQRLQDLTRNCKSKNKNIRGTMNEQIYFIGSAKRDPSDIDLARYPDVYGYERISKKRYKELQKENDAKGKSKFLSKDNQIVRAVYLTGNHLSAADIQDLGLDPRDNLYYGNPENNLIRMENEKSPYINFLNEQYENLQKKK